MAARPFCGRYGRGRSWHLPVTTDQQGDGKAGAENGASARQSEGSSRGDVGWLGSGRLGRSSVGGH